MGTYFITARLKKDAAGRGMYFSGTPTAVNAAGTFSIYAGNPPTPVTGSFTFDSEFDNSTTLLRAAGGKFYPYFTYYGGSAQPDGPLGFRWFGSEQEIYTTGSYTAVPYNPFTISGGTLKITAIPKGTAYAASPQPYLSGMIETSNGAFWEDPAIRAARGGFEQKYGYWEIRCKMPRGQGVWCAFWLDGGITYNITPGNSHGEIDIFETQGVNSLIYQTVHDWWAVPDTFEEHDLTVSYDTAFHTYGLNWTPDDIIWTIDGVETFRATTAMAHRYRDIAGPMYLVCNMAMGGWLGPPDGTTPFPAVMEIDYIRVTAYSAPPVLVESQNNTTIPPATVIVDSLNASWTVAAGVIYRNTIATISNSVTLLLYNGRKVYQQNSAGNWWFWDDNIIDGSNPWTATTDPRVVSSGMPNITPLSRHPHDFLQVGNPAINTYWIHDNRWGQDGIVEGGGAGQFSEAVERSLVVGPAGEVAFRTQYSWPVSIGGVLVDGGPYPEVKAYPSIIYGKKPGYFSTSQWPAFDLAVRLPDGVSVPTPPAGTPSNIASDWVAAGGSVATVAPSGNPPGDALPKQLLLSAGALTISGMYSVSATGKCHLSFDILLQAPGHPEQIAGFAASPVTHEVMIPLRNFGGYGQPGNRNPAWYDHDVTIDGVLYHVYCAKDFGTDGAGSNGLRYSFSYGTLNGAFTNEETGLPRRGWKFIVFQHDGVAHPLQPDGSFRVDLSKFLNHLKTVSDSRGITFVQGTEYVSSVELGVEMVVGTGDWTVYNYKVVP